jgi:DNA-binding transcriptional ArsR family regulator
MTAATKLTDLFRVLSQPARLQMVRMIGEDEVCVCQLMAVLDKRQAYISQQMSVLREAGLVESSKSGRNKFYRLVDPKVLDVVEAAAAFMGVELPDVEVPDIAEVSACGCPAPIGKE